MSTLPIHPKRWHLSWRGHKEIIVLAALTIFLTATTVIWFVLDREPPWWDDSFYLAKSLLMFDALVDGGVAGYIKKFLSIIPNRPPLIAALPTPFYMIFGRDPRYAFGVNLLFVPVLLGSVYLLGKKFWGKRAGLIAAYVVGTMPLMYGLARWYLVEFTLTALVSLAICILVESEDLRRFRMTLWFSFVCGFGLLLKVTFPLFVFPLFLFVFFRYLSSSKPLASPDGTPATPRIKTLAALIFPPVLVALPWYFRNYQETIHLVLFAGFSPDADTYGTGPVFSFRAIYTYLSELAGSGTSYYYVLLAIVLATLIVGSGKVWPFFQGLGKRQLAILLLWGLPFVLFLFGRNKNLRYVAPLLPVFGLVLAVALDFVLRTLPKWQTRLLCLVLIFPALSLLQKSFFIFGDRIPGLNHFLCVGSLGDAARKYERAQWPLEDILSTLSRQTRFEPGKKKIVMVGTDRAFFNADNFQLAAVRGRLPFEVTTSAHATDLDTLLRSLNSASFFIYKEGGEPESPFYNGYQGALIREVQSGGKFTELPQHWSLPDGGNVRVFKNLTPGWSIVKHAFTPTGIEPISSCEANFDNQIELTGLSIEQSESILRVKYRWLCLAPPDREYWCFTHLLDESGKVVGFLDHPIAGGEPPMISWKKGDAAIEELQFPIPLSASQIKFRLLLGLYNVPSGQRLVVRSYALSGTSHACLADTETALLVSPSAENIQNGAKPSQQKCPSK
ncbi:MAG TPA: glycosyltransferase family 39 protein [Terriglobia bacterium]|nr:glycosyltransferase family 39 protein [Terriglobia bacterium]